MQPYAYQNDAHPQRAGWSGPRGQSEATKPLSHGAQRSQSQAPAPSARSAAPRPAAIGRSQASGGCRNGAPQSRDVGAVLGRCRRGGTARRAARDGFDEAFVKTRLGTPRAPTNASAQVAAATPAPAPPAPFDPNKTMGAFRRADACRGFGTRLVVSASVPRRDGSFRTGSHSARRAADGAARRLPGAGSRRRRGCHVEIPRTGRGGAGGAA